MHRTTILISPELKSQAIKKAREMGVSLGELIRLSLKKIINSKKDNSRKHDLLFSDQTIFKEKAPKDLAKNHDDYLYGEHS